MSNYVDNILNSNDFKNLSPQDKVTVIGKIRQKFSKELDNLKVPMEKGLYLSAKFNNMLDEKAKQHGVDIPTLKNPVTQKTINSTKRTINEDKKQQYLDALSKQNGSEGISDATLDFVPVEKGLEGIGKSIVINSLAKGAGEATGEAINKFTPEENKKQYPNYYNAMQIVGQLASMGAVYGRLTPDTTEAINNLKDIKNKVESGDISLPDADEQAQSILNETKVPKEDINIIKQIKTPAPKDNTEPIQNIKPTIEQTDKPTQQVDDNKIIEEVKNKIPNADKQTQQRVVEKVKQKIQENTPPKDITVPEEKLQGTNELQIPKITNLKEVHMDNGGTYEEYRNLALQLGDNREYKEKLYPIRRTSKGGLGYGENQNTSVYIRPIYEDNPNYDFELTKTDVAQIKKGNITPKRQARLDHDIERLKNDPAYKGYFEKTEPQDLKVNDKGEILDENGKVLFFNPKHLGVGALVGTANAMNTKGTIQDKEKAFIEGFLGGSLGSKMTAEALKKVNPKLYNHLADFVKTDNGVGAFAGGEPIYRGINPNETRKDILTWYTKHKHLAEEYAGKDGEVIEKPAEELKNPLEVGNIEKEMSPRDFVISLKNNNKDMPLTKEEFKKLSTTPQKMHDLLKDKNILYFVKKAGFDGVIAKERGKETIGYFNKKNSSISPYILAGSAGATINGIQIDNKGNVSFDAKKAILGFLGGVATLKGINLSKDAFLSVKAQQVLKKLTNITFIKNIWDSETLNKIIGHKIYLKKDYMKIREDAIKEENSRQESYLELHKQLALLSEKTRTGLYHYMNGKDIKLPKELKAFADAYTNYIIWAGQDLVNLKVFSQEAFDRFKGQYLKRSFLKDINGKYTMSGDNKTINTIYERGNVWYGTEKDLEGFKETNQLGKFTDGKIEYSKTGKNTYRFKQDWTPEQLKEWEEVTDIAYVLPDTLRHIDNMRIHAKFLAKVANKTSYAFKEEAPNTVLLKGKRFGELNGKYVASDVSNDIEDFNVAIFGRDNSNFLLSEKGAELFYKYSTFWKKTHTIYNTTAHINNIMSNISMIYLSGTNPVKTIKYAIDGVNTIRKLATFRDLTARKLIGLSEEETHTLKGLEQDRDLKLYLQAERKGLFNRSRLRDILSQYIDNSPKVKRGFFNKIDKTASSLYEGEDNLMRFSLLKSLIDRMPLTQAIDEVNKNIPDYTKPLSVWAKFGRKSMLTPFISWTYYATPMLIRQSIEHPERLAVIYSMLYGMNKLMGIDPNNKQDIPQRNFAWSRIPIFKNGDEVTTIKVDRWIPYSDLFHPVNFVKNFFTGGAYAAFYGSMNNYNPYFNGKITYRKGLKKDYDIGKYFIQSYFTPDIVDNAWNLAESKLIGAKVRKKHPVIVPRSTTQEIVKMFGFNTLTYNKAEQERKVKLNIMKETMRPIKNLLIFSKHNILNMEQKQKVFKNVKIWIQKGYIKPKQGENMIKYLIKNQILLNMGITNGNR